jgi:hypothetical protein
MSDISYAGAPVPVRDDLAAAHRRAWERLAQPGNWWTGAQRVAMGGEIRNAARCALCRERKAALSPYGVAGEHDTVSDLPNAAVDVIHRVVTDPGRLSRKWFDGVLVAGLSDAEYVEVIGVVVAWVATIPGTRATGAEKDLYGSAAYAANVIRALSLVPDAVRQLQDLSAAHYLRPAEMIDLTRGRSIDRAQMELVAGRVSALRECFY